MRHITIARPRIVSRVGLAAAAVFVVGSVALSTTAAAQTRAALVRDVDTPALQPFRGSVIISPFATLNEQRLLTTVPAGKRLVIEQVSYTAGGQSGQVVFGALRTGQFGPIQQYLQINPPHASATAPFVLQDGTSPVHVYFEAGEEVWVTVTSTASLASFQLAAQGYFVTP